MGGTPGSKKKPAAVVDREVLRRKTRGMNPDHRLKNHCGPCDLEFKTLEGLHKHQADEHGVKFIVR